MSFTILDKSIRKVGVIGSGQIGPDIALYFAKVFDGHGIPITIVDVSQDALTRGRQKLDRKIDKGVDSGAFKPELGAAMKASCVFTSEYEALRGVDFVVEAATEDRALKGRIFKQVSALCAPGAILASNSSHLEPEVIFGELTDRSRTLVIHYFFPAERNPMVEIVPGKDSDPRLAPAMLNFYELIGKTPIQVGSRYGYALDPVFEGVFQAAALLVEAGAGTTREIDTVATRALGLTVGPFTAMNLTGGNPITHHGLGQYTAKIMPWYRSPKLLADAVAAGKAWEVPGRGEKIEVDAARTQTLTDALQGAFFGIVCEVLDSGISNVGDLDMAVELGLDMAAPFRLMNKLGVGRARELVEKYSASQTGFKVSSRLRKQADSKQPWDIPVVFRHDIGDVAVVRIRRPKVLNALSAETFDQLERVFSEIKNDHRVVGAVLTGSGVKSFVSGADVNFLARIESAAQGETTSLASNRCFSVIEDLGKPVVCALNGFAFGGGNELAMACTARIARKGLSPLAAQPEPNLGIIPGAGGTQRLPRLIGVEQAAALLRTGRAVSSAEAAQLGLITREVDGDLIATAVQMVRDAVSGKAPLRGIERGPIAVPTRLPDVDIKHLSRAVDRIVCRAILEGCGLPLKEGLAFESKMFGAVCETRDMRIGVENFLKNGPRTPAQFTHE